MVQDIPGQISITFDAWISDASNPYLRVTAHYIHLEADVRWNQKRSAIVSSNKEG
jgi:hypothetical protein